MARLVMVKGDGGPSLIDLDKNPWAESFIDTGKLTVVEEVKELPADPWAPKKAQAPKPNSGPTKAPESAPEGGPKDTPSAAPVAGAKPPEED